MQCMEFLLKAFCKVWRKGKNGNLDKTFTYGRLRNVEYKDSDSPDLILDVEISNGTRRILVDEGNLVVEGCSPKILRKDIQTKTNLIVSLRPYVTRELMVTETETPPKKSRKSKPEHKKYQKQPKPCCLYRLTQRVRRVNVERTSSTWSGSVEQARAGSVSGTRKQIRIRNQELDRNLDQCNR